MTSTSLYVVVFSVSMPLPASAAGTCPLVSAFVATSRCSHSEKQLQLIGATS
jgi:hypothetical protein